MQQGIDLNRERLTTTEASERSNLHPYYLATLARTGKLEGFQMGRDWFIYADSLEKYLATPRKSGPKGPRKKSVDQKSEDQKQGDTPDKEP